MVGRAREEKGEKVRGGEPRALEPRPGGQGLKGGHGPTQFKIFLSIVAIKDFHWKSFFPT